MTMTLPVSEVRKELPKLLKKLQKNRNNIVKITVHGAVVGELRASRPTISQMLPGTALLQAARSIGKRTEPYPEGRSVSREHNFFLYGDGAKK